MRNRLALAAIALWVLTLAAAAIVFIRGNTVPSPDGRTTVLVQPGEREFVLDEMRSLLVAVRDIEDGIIRDDKAKVAAAARTVGMAAAHDAAPALMAKLPLDFKGLALPLHRGFDELAAAAEHGEPAPALTARLTGQLDRCVACHAAYRLGVSQ